MKTIRPWPFQKKAVAAAVDALARGKRVLVVSPGGSGKTVMIAALAAREWHRGKKVLIISHRREILSQTFIHLRRCGIPEHDLGVIMAKAPPDRINPSAPVQIAGIQSLLRREDKPPADVVIIDEAHHALAKGFYSLVMEYEAAQHAGFTATPFRLDGCGLGNFYGEMIIAAVPSELMRAHRLAEPILYSAIDEAQPDLRSVRVSRGDYVVSDLQPRLMKAQIIGSVPDSWASRARGRQSMAWGLSIVHSKALNDRFRAAGVRSAHVDGKMAPKQRDGIIRRFVRREYEMLCSCDILVEGFDFPECDAGVLARPTKSLSVFLQQCARVLRYHPGPRPILLDHARLFAQFGLPEADRPYDLTDGKMAPEIINPCPARVCLNGSCQRVFPASEEICPGCGARFVEPRAAKPKPTGPGRIRMPQEIDGILVEYTPQEKRQLIERLQEIAAEKGLSQQWVEDVVRVWAGYRVADDAA